MWKKVNNCHLKNGEWTISKSQDKKAPYPYGLWECNVNKGFFNSADEAKAKYMELNK